MQISGRRSIPFVALIRKRWKIKLESLVATKRKWNHLLALDKLLVAQAAPRNRDLGTGKIIWDMFWFDNDKVRIGS